MRIAYVLTSLGIGGAERQVLALADRMAERGHAVKLLVLRPPLAKEFSTAHEVFRLEIRRTPGSVLAGMERGRRFLRGFAPDLIHSHSFHANFVARLLKLSLPGARQISTVHNVYEGGWRRMLAYRLTDAPSALTTAVSEAARERFVRLGAVPRSKCVAVTNGIDTKRFAPEPERRIAMRAVMRAGDAFVWLAAGRIVPAKDFPNLLRAFALVRREHPAMELWIAGEAWGEDSKRLQEGSVREGGLEGVRWLGLRRDMPALLDACDGFVLASAWEGMPLALGEAMAMEKPVVATDVGGVRELVGEAGTIVPAGNSLALAGAMLDSMRQSEGDRRALGAAARRRIETSFSMDVRAVEWAAIYREVLDGNGVAGKA